MIFSSIKCFNADHKKKNIKFSFSHFESHFEAFPSELKGLNLENFMIDAINHAINVNLCIRTIKRIEESQKKRKLNKPSQKMKEKCSKKRH